MTATPTGGYALPQPPPAQQKKPSGCKILSAGCAVIFVAVCAFIAVIAVLVFGAMRRTDAYRTGFERATHDPRVKAALGAPIEAGLFVSGNVRSGSGHATANIRFSILGTRQNASVHVIGEREGREWHYTVMMVEPDHGEAIDLLKPQ
jgi:hypothetical protein